MKKLLLASVAALALAGCAQIDTGNIGIESTLGQVKPETLPPGLYMTVFKSVMEVTTKETPVDLADLKPKTRDNVTLADVDITIYYKINPALAAKIYTKYVGDVTYFKETGDAILGANLITRTTREAVYSAVAQFNSYDVHTKRAEIADYVQRQVKSQLSVDAPDMFEITNVIVRNIVTDPRLEEAIKQSAEMEFQVRRKKQELDLALAESDRKKIEADGVSRANKIVAESLSPLLIELRRIEAMERFAEKGGASTIILGPGSEHTNTLLQVK